MRRRALRHDVRVQLALEHRAGEDAGRSPSASADDVGRRSRGPAARRASARNRASDRCAAEHDVGRRSAADQRRQRRACTRRPCTTPSAGCSSAITSATSAAARVPPPRRRRQPQARRPSPGRRSAAPQRSASQIARLSAPSRCSAMTRIMASFHCGLEHDETQADVDFASATLTCRSPLSRPCFGRATRTLALLRAARAPVPWRPRRATRRSSGSASTSPGRRGRRSAGGREPGRSRHARISFFLAAMMPFSVA